MCTFGSHTKSKYIEHACLCICQREGELQERRTRKAVFILNVKTPQQYWFLINLQWFYNKILKHLKANLLYKLFLQRRKMFDIPDSTINTYYFLNFRCSYGYFFSLIGNGWWFADKLGGFTRRMSREQGCSTCTYASQTKTWWIRRGWDEKYPWPGNCTMPIPQFILNLIFNMIKK